MLERRRRFQFCIERFQSIGRLFLQLPQPGSLSFSRLGCPSLARSGAIPDLVGRSFRGQPFPGADSIFSSRCGAISGRLRFAVSLSRRDPGDPNASVQKSMIGSAGMVYQMLWIRGFRGHTISRRGFNLFKVLRRPFRTTPFCCQPLAPRAGLPNSLGSKRTIGSAGAARNKYRTATQLLQEIGSVSV